MACWTIEVEVHDQACIDDDTCQARYKVGIHDDVCHTDDLEDVLRIVMTEVLFLTRNPEGRG